MLILPYAYRLGVDLDQFSERVDESAADGDGTAHRHVFVGKLLARHIGGRIHRRAVLADHVYRFLGQQTTSLHEFLRLARGCAVADGHGVETVLLYQAFYRAVCTGEVVARRHRVYHRVVEQVALLVERDHLASRPVAGVDGQNAVSLQRGAEQELAEVSGEDVDGHLVGLLLKRRRDFRLHRRLQQSLRSVLHG